MSALASCGHAAEKAYGRVVPKPAVSRCSKRYLYSISSLARRSSDSGRREGPFGARGACNRPFATNHRGPPWPGVGWLHAHRLEGGCTRLHAGCTLPLYRARLRAAYRLRATSLQRSLSRARRSAGMSRQRSLRCSLSWARRSSGMLRQRSRPYARMRLRFSARYFRFRASARSRFFSYHARVDSAMRSRFSS